MSQPSSSICFIINRTKTNPKSFEEEAKRVFYNYELMFKYTSKKGHGIELAKEQILNKCNFLIAVGGDGTINEVVNGFMNSDVENRKKVILGLIPRGTGNDFARSIFAKKQMKSLADSIMQNRIGPCDVGEVNFVDELGLPKKRFFINIADVGIGANTVQIVNKSSKKLGSNLTFIFAILKSFVGYRHLKVKIKADGFNYEGKIVTLCFANGKWFGSGLGIAPHAKLDDGNIALVMAGEVKMRTFLAKLPAIKKLKFIKHKDVFYKKIESCKIEPANQKCPLEADGELLGFLPAEVKIHKHATRFVLGKPE